MANNKDLIVDLNSISNVAEHTVMEEPNLIFNENGEIVPIEHPVCNSYFVWLKYGKPTPTLEQKYKILDEYTPKNVSVANSSSKVMFSEVHFTEKHIQITAKRIAEQHKSHEIIEEKVDENLGAKIKMIKTILNKGCNKNPLSNKKLLLMSKTGIRFVQFSGTDTQQKFMKCVRENLKIVEMKGSSSFIYDARFTKPGTVRHKIDCCKQLHNVLSNIIHNCGIVGLIDDYTLSGMYNFAFYALLNGSVAYSYDEYRMRGSADVIDLYFKSYNYTFYEEFLSKMDDDMQYPIDFESVFSY
jgi:hypothetical protein